MGTTKLTSTPQRRNAGVMTAPFLKFKYATEPVKVTLRCLSCGAKVERMPEPGQGLPCGH